MRSRKEYLVLLYLMLATGISWAGDLRSLSFIGFSEDGSYLAFLQSAVSWGSGEPYSEVAFVSVPDNKWIGKPIGFSEGRHVKLNDPAVVKTMSKLKIQHGNTGDHLVSRPFGPMDRDIKGTEKTQPEDFQVQFNLPTADRSTDDHLQVNIKESPVENSECQDWDVTPKIIEVTVKNLNSGQSLVLQKDTKMPKSRAPCTYRYRLQDVYVYGHREIAIFLNVFSPAIEGHNMTFLCITGDLGKIQSKSK